MNNKQVFDITTIGYTDWYKTTNKVIEFGIKHWNGQEGRKPMVFNFPVYVGTVNQCLTFVGQLNNRLKLAGLRAEATWNRLTGKVEVTYID